MTRNLSKWFGILALLSLPYMIKAQETGGKGVAQPHISHYFHLAFNTGAATPLSFPGNIRKVQHYSSLFSPVVGYEANLPLKGRWQVYAGLGLSWKGMEVTDSVAYLHTLIKVDSAEIEGDFTGNNKTTCRNIYLNLPLGIAYTAGDNWRLRAGLYLGFLLRPSFSGTVSDGYLRRGNSLGEKITIDEASFNFDDEQRKFDFGIDLAVAKKVYKKFSLSGNLQWGLQPLFPSGFKGVAFNMYNIFFALGVQYRL